MKFIGDMLKEAMPRTEVLRMARAQIAMKLWPEIVGPAVAERVRCDRYDRGVLFVASDSSAWTQEIQMQKETILGRLNQAAGEELFKDIRAGRPYRKAKPEA